MAQDLITVNAAPRMDRATYDAFYAAVSVLVRKHGAKAAVAAPAPVLTRLAIERVVAELRGAEVSTRLLDDLVAELVRTSRDHMLGGRPSKMSTVVSKREMKQAAAAAERRRSELQGDITSHRIALADTITKREEKKELGMQMLNAGKITQEAFDAGIKNWDDKVNYVRAELQVFLDQLADPFSDDPTKEVQ